MVVYPSKKRYDAENVVRVTVAFNRNTDPEATEFIEHKERRGEYIRQLVRDDVEKRKRAAEGGE
jgi:hypothetical protein